MRYLGPPRRTDSAHCRQRTLTAPPHSWSDLLDLSARWIIFKLQQETFYPNPPAMLSSRTHARHLQKLSQEIQPFPGPDQFFLLAQLPFRKERRATHIYQPKPYSKRSKI